MAVRIRTIVRTILFVYLEQLDDDLNTNCLVTAFVLVGQEISYAHLPIQLE